MAHQTPDFYEPTGTLIVPKNTAVNIGDYVDGYGIKPETRVTGVTLDNTIGQLRITLNKKPWTGNTPPTGIYQSGATGDDWYLAVTFSNFKIDGIYSESKDTTLSFREDIKGWVSFKSFIPENGISVANEYYTLINGKLFKHHVEGVNRNTFYKGEVILPFTESSINVILNDVPGTVKSFNALNYEGSQSKINVNTQDDQYFNLEAKKGWYVESIKTDKEKGSLNEFIEKEGKWFNYLKGQSIETTNKNNLIIDEDGSSSFDQASFAIQGIGTAISGTVNCIYGCTDESNYYFNSLANCEDGSCAPTPSWDCIGGNCIDPGDGKGYYTSLATCQNLCKNVLESWDCTQKDPSLPGTCIDPGTGNGEFGSLSACQNGCGGFASWTCGAGQAGCIDGGSSGPYQTLAECQTAPCPPITWDCVDIGDADACISNSQGNGEYTTLELCQATCNPPCWDFGSVEVIQTGQASCCTGDESGCSQYWPEGQVLFGGNMNIPPGIAYHFEIIDLSTGQNILTPGTSYNTLGCEDGVWNCSQVPIPQNSWTQKNMVNLTPGDYMLRVVFNDGVYGVDNGCPGPEAPFTISCPESAPEVSYDCNNGVCSDPGTGLGAYTSLSDCQKQCTVLETWNCSKGNCIDPGNGSGQYTSLSECQLACTVESYDCNNGTCSDPGTGGGQYSSLFDCQNNCTPPCPSGVLELQQIAGADNQSCDNGTVTLNAHSINPATPWYFVITLSADPTAVIYTGQYGGGFNGSIGSTTVQYLLPGDYTAYVVFENDCPGMQQSFTIDDNCAVCDINLVSSTVNPATNAGCNNGSHTVNVTSTLSGTYTVAYYQATTPGQISGGTLVQHVGPTPSGTNSSEMGLPLSFGENWYFTAYDGPNLYGGQIGPCSLGYNTAFTMTCDGQGDNIISSGGEDKQNKR